MIFSVCLLMTGIAGAQTVFSGKGIYISENGEMAINTDKVILDSVKGSGTIKFGENTKEIVVSDKSVLKNIKFDERRQYLVKVKTSNKDENVYYLVKNKNEEDKVKTKPKLMAKAATSIIPKGRKVDSEKEKDATLKLTKVVLAFEKGNSMNGGVIVPNILSLAPIIQQDLVHLPNILYTTNKSNLYGYVNEYSFCIYADIMKPPITV